MDAGEQAIWREADRILDELLDLPAPERLPRLQRMPLEPALRERVARLLAAHTEPDGPLDGSLPSLFEVVGSGPVVDWSGQHLGRWHLLEQIGRGGMAVVYRVERVDGAYRQQAALKLIRSAADTPAARERFLHERQTLARLQHPHIATLLDGGFSTDGDPYLVMEYIDGMPLDRWCDDRRLGLRERVGLFQQVLDAVQYAHRNLVVHRDLKPSNVLVDQTGQAKLLDFGIAKDLQDASLTVTHEHALTFEYASPEQLHAAPITTATDVWQLGVVLYRLLSGAHPFGLDSETTPPARQLQLLEREPEPLARAAARATPEKAALRGGLTPTALARELRGPLAKIVQGCLRREPASRYPSVAALAEDLHNWIEHRPIKIAPTSRRTAAKLWLRRNRALASAFTAILLAVFGGAGAALWQAHKAQMALRTATEAANTLVIDLAKAFKDRGLPSDLTGTILERTRELQDDLAVNFPDDPGLQGSRAMALGETGDLQARQGDATAARASYGQALAIYRQLAAQDPQTTRWTRNVSLTLGRIGALQADAGDVAGARKSFEEDLSISRRLAAREPDNAERASDVAIGLAEIGALQANAGDAAGARTYFEEALAIRRRLAAQRPDDGELARYVAVGVERIGNLQANTGDALGARKSYEESLSIVRRLAAQQPANTMLARDVSVGLNKVGGLQAGTGDVAGARKSYEESLAIRRRLAAQDPKNTQWASDVAFSLGKVGSLQAATGNAADARKSFEDALAISRQQAQAAPENVQDALVLIDGLQTLSTVSSGAERRDLLEQAYQRTLALKARGALPAEEANWPDQLQQELAKLDTAARRGNQ